MNRAVKNALRVLRALESYRIDGAELFRFAFLGFTPPQRVRVGRMFPQASRLIAFLPYVPKAALGILYKHAFGFIYPSLSEGFGYPPLEAMRHGTPVIASAVTSIPEVGADAALYLNPYDVGEIAARLSQFIADEDLRKRLALAGPNRFRYFESLRLSQVDGFVDYLL